MKKIVLLAIMVFFSSSVYAAESPARLYSIASSRAAAAQNRGDYAEAEKWHRNALSIVLNARGAPVIQKITAMMNLASLLELRKKPEEALALLSESNRLISENPTIPSMFLAVNLTNMGRAMEQLNQLDAAENCLNRAEALFEGGEFKDSPLRGAIDTGMGYVLKKRGRLREADLRLEKGIAAFSKILPENHPFLAEAIAVRKEIQDQIELQR